jgi:hypothetical protein
MSMVRPASSEFGEWYAGYVTLVPEGDIVDALARQRDEITSLFASVAPAREQFRYAPGKWTIRELAGHISDGERIFGTRALCFSRGETSELPGFDENLYVAEAGFNDRALSDLVEEWVALRTANLAMCRSLRDEQWSRRGVASGNPITVRALAWIMVGHTRHHAGVLQERYGV